MVGTAVRTVMRTHALNNREYMYAWELTDSNALIGSPIGAGTTKWCVFSRLSTREAALEAALIRLVTRDTIGIRPGSDATELGRSCRK